MKPDNEWHEAICVKLIDGGFRIHESLESAKEDERAIGEYQEVKVNWNRGEPIVDFGDFKMSIVDIDLQK